MLCGRFSIPLSNSRPSKIGGLRRSLSVDQPTRYKGSQEKVDAVLTTGEV